MDERPIVAKYELDDIEPGLKKQFNIIVTEDMCNQFASALLFLMQNKRGKYLTYITINTVLPRCDKYYTYYKYVTCCRVRY